MTVADDLLRNDGQRFLEMMEHLAERRLAREESMPAGQNKPGQKPLGAEEEGRFVIRIWCRY